MRCTRLPYLHITPVPFHYRQRRPDCVVLAENSSTASVEVGHGLSEPNQLHSQPKGLPNIKKCVVVKISVVLHLSEPSWRGRSELRPTSSFKIHGPTPIIPRWDDDEHHYLLFESVSLSCLMQYNNLESTPKGDRMLGKDFALSFRFSSPMLSGHHHHDDVYSTKSLSQAAVAGFGHGTLNSIRWHTFSTSFGITIRCGLRAGSVLLIRACVIACLPSSFVRICLKSSDTWHMVSRFASDGASCSRCCDNDVEAVRG